MFLLPIAVDRPLTRIPGCLIALVATNIVVFGLTHFGGDELGAFSRNGLIPAAWTVRTAFTSMFVHGGYGHLVGNMIFLWMYGKNVEEAIGSVLFLAVFLLAGLAASALQIACSPGSLVPCVGASGAISGVLGVYLLLFPRDRVNLVAYLGWIRLGVIHTRAPAAILAWLGEQTLLGLLATFTGLGQFLGVAFWAHVGGIVGGIALGAMLRAAGYAPGDFVAATPAAPLRPANDRARELYAANLSFIDIAVRLQREGYPPPPGGNWSPADAERLAFQPPGRRTFGPPVRLRPSPAQSAGGGLLAIGAFAAIVGMRTLDDRNGKAHSNDAERMNLPLLADCLLDGAATKTDIERWPDLQEKLIKDAIEEARPACTSRIPVRLSRYNEQTEVHDATLRREARIVFNPQDAHEQPRVERAKIWTRDRAGAPWVPSP